MAWLEAHQELRDHPKTKRAARTLGISRPQMIGHLLCLWWWCLDYAETGSLADFNNDDIADAAAWEGDPDTFVSALLNCGPADRPGFLIDTGAGLTVNDWDEYGGKYVTKRNQGRERQRTYRQRNAVVTRDSSVSNTPREDKSIVEERKEQNHQTNGRDSAEDALIDPDIAKAIARWTEVFAGTPNEGNPPVSQMTKWLAYYGPDVLCHMIGKAQDKQNPAGWMYTTYDNWRKDGEVAPYVLKEVAAGKPKAKRKMTIVNPFTDERTEVEG